MIIDRYLKNVVHEDLKEKMVFISGPRQVGKTTFAKTLLKNPDDTYLNWDNREDRKLILKGRWPTDESVVVLDELHKYGKWKQFIKGEYDTHGNQIRFMVTGSARMDVYRKGGDSLQGRYHSHRLHGFSVGELAGKKVELKVGHELPISSTFESGHTLSLFHYGGFPEPYIKQNERAVRRWQKERLDRFFREDIRDLENVRDLSALELLADLLVSRVSSLLSLQSIREDLEVSHRAVSSWIDIFERLYLCFRIYPFFHTSIRSLKKSAKIYFWDWRSINDEGARFENLVACHLLKLKHVLEDQEGYRIGLNYLRDTDKREVDFLVTKDQSPWFIVECKKSQKRISKNINYFAERLKIPWRYQVVMSEGVDYLENGVRVISADKFLSSLP